jgi:hypothetical protein
VNVRVRFVEERRMVGGGKGGTVGMTERVEEKGSIGKRSFAYGASPGGMTHSCPSRMTTPADDPPPSQRHRMP